MREPVQINVGTVNVLEANKDITQTIFVVNESDKIDKLTEILSRLVQQHQEQKAAGGSVVVDVRRLKEPTGGTAGRHAGAHGAKLRDKVIVFGAKKVSCHHLAQQLVRRARIARRMVRARERERVPQL